MGSVLRCALRRVSSIHRGVSSFEIDVYSEIKTNIFVHMQEPLSILIYRSFSFYFHLLKIVACNLGTHFFLSYRYHFSSFNRFERILGQSHLLTLVRVPFTSFTPAFIRPLL